jgi:hypothetical protein
MPLACFLSPHHGHARSRVCAGGWQRCTEHLAWWYAAQADATVLNHEHTYQVLEQRYNALATELTTVRGAPLSSERGGKERGRQRVTRAVRRDRDRERRRQREQSQAVREETPPSVISAAATV